jgi:hypothetical protein
VTRPFTGVVVAAVVSALIDILRNALTGVVATKSLHHTINMAEPPSYEESTARVGKSRERKGDQKTPQPWNIREQVGLSRTQHVAAIVAQIGDHIRECALQGLSKTTMVLIPSDQGKLFQSRHIEHTLTRSLPDASRNGVVVGFPDDDAPTMIQFEGRQNGVQFWLQNEVLFELKVQLQHAVSDGMPVERTRRDLEAVALPPHPPQKISWFGRKSSKAAVPVREEVDAACPVTVDVHLDEVHFRSESEYGLYETLRAKVVMAVVDVR